MLDDLAVLCYRDYATWAAMNAKDAEGDRLANDSVLRKVERESAGQMKEMLGRILQRGEPRKEAVKTVRMSAVKPPKIRP